jgi:hypothetical protein
MPYESEFTHFLKDLKARRPDIEADQREGRAIWWDRDAIDLEQVRREKESRVPARAYPYQSKD